MKRLLMIGILSLNLGACASVGGLPGLSPELSADLQKAQLLVRQVCGVLPDIAAIANLFSSNPTLMTAESIVGYFCSHAQVRTLKRTKLYHKYRNKI